MSELFDIAFEDTVGVEGEFIDDPDDSGGATKFGITERVARAYGYVGSMKELPLEKAKEIYRIGWWDFLKLEEIGSLSEMIAHEIFDTAVNCSVGFAGRSLQECLNVFNRGGKDYDDIVVDGLIGRMTLKAFLEYLANRSSDGEIVLMNALNCEQGHHYISLAKSRPKDEKYIFGWFLNRVGVK